MLLEEKVIEGKKCTGCSACCSRCPVNAIDMVYDSEGFQYPRIDHAKCISCGICEKVCPELNVTKTEGMKHEEGKCYAVMANDDIRAVSSSGGMFTLMADAVLEEQGIVCGAAYTDDYMSVKHIVIDKKSELSKLRGSKYVQSSIGCVYKEIGEVLKKGRKVLFVGCPCQVVGLYSYLGEEQENLYTADLVCHGSNSLTAYQSFVKETANGREIKEVNFRDKTVYGWSTPTTIYFKDGSVYNATWDQSKWNTGFLGGIINRVCCKDCRYAMRTRVGDITLGDFWQIHRWDKDCNDWKGTSLVLVNTEKGNALFKKVMPQMKLCKEAPLDFAVQYNGQLTRPNKAHPGRKFFFHHLPKDGYHKALWYGQKYRYDVGLVGWWFAANYGSVLTYYALGNILEDMDLLPIMIRIPKKDNSSWEAVTQKNIEFMSRYFPVSKERKFEDLKECNRFCDMFMTGSDQLWVSNYIRDVGYTFFLDFVDRNKKKIAYATSLGYEKFDGDVEQRAMSSVYLKDFDYVSVREASGVQACQLSFGVDAVRMLDPVFLCGMEHYETLADVSVYSDIEEDYLLCYILDPSPEKEAAIEWMQKQLGLQKKVIFDMKSFERCKAGWTLGDVVEDVSIEDFVCLIKKCRFMISDSHHGICFGILFHKNFVCVANAGRGLTRFESLFELLHIKKHMVYSAGEIPGREDLLEPVNYEEVDEILKREKDNSFEWLKKALVDEKEKLPNTALYLIDKIKELEKKLKVLEMNSQKK